MTDTSSSRVSRAPGRGAEEDAYENLASTACPDCKGQIELDRTALRATCHTRGCRFHTRPMSFYTSGVPSVNDPNPPGLPRPSSQDAPVPWSTPIAHGHALWRRLDFERIWLCQRDWLCQVCGKTLSAKATAVVDDKGNIVSDAAMHTACLSMARNWCPEIRDGLANGEYRTVELTQDSVMADDTPLPEHNKNERTLWRYVEPDTA